jgi:hypothetical protein
MEGHLNKYIEMGILRFGKGSLTEFLDDGVMYSFTTGEFDFAEIYFSRFATMPSNEDGEWKSVGLLFGTSTHIPAGTFTRVDYAKFFHPEPATDFEEMCESLFELVSDAYLCKAEGREVVFRII